MKKDSEQRDKKESEVGREKEGEGNKWIDCERI